MNADRPYLSRRKVLGQAAALVCGGIAVAQADELEDEVKIIHWPTLKLVGGCVLRPVDWTGVAAIVVFWATWCPYCKRHNARLNKLFHALGNKRIRILGVAAEESEAQLAAYARANALDFPLVVGDSQFKMQFSSRKVFPLTCLVRGDGKLIQVIPGELAEADVLSLPSLFEDRLT